MSTKSLDFWTSILGPDYKVEINDFIKITRKFQHKINLAEMKLITKDFKNKQQLIIKRRTIVYDSEVSNIKIRLYHSFFVKNLENIIYFIKMIENHNSLYKFLISII